MYLGLWKTFIFSYDDNGSKWRALVVLLLGSAVVVGYVPQPGPVCLDPAQFRKHICVCVCEAYFYFAVENRIDASRSTSSASSRYVVLPRSVDQYIITVWSGVQAAGRAQNQSAGDSDTALTVPLSCMFPGHVHDITDHDIAVAEIKANARCRSVPAHETGWRRKSLTIERRLVAVVVWMAVPRGIRETIRHTRSLLLVRYVAACGQRRVKGDRSPLSAVYMHGVASSNCPLHALHQSNHREH